MKRKLLNCQDPILRKKSQEVQNINLDTRYLCQEMMKIMVENKGIGLAAPQVGELKRIILVQKEEEIKIFINPKILKKSKETELGEEGCLSIPNVRLNIKRAKELEIEAFNLEGDKIRVKVKGLLSRIFQHEIDHLNGILIINKINFWQRLKIKSKLKQ